MENGALLSLLQLSDSAFPTGGFSHSLGLEASLQQKIIYDKNDVYNYILCSLENAASFNLPFVRESYNFHCDGDKLVAIDNLCEACTGNHVANRASQRQGKSMLDTCSKAFQAAEIVSLKSKLKYFHHCVVFGSVCCIMGIDLQTTLVTYMFNTLRTVVASAVRLDKFGPLEAQTVQTELQGKIQSIIERNKNRSAEDACVVCPVIDVVQNTHDQMFSKLFYS